MIKIPSKVHLYANNNLVSFQYDKPECRASGAGDYRCDVLLTELVDENRTLWVIECKEKVNRSVASHAFDQIESCLRVMSYPSGWKINKCVVGSSFTNDGAQFLGEKRVLHYKRDPNRYDRRIRDVLNAVDHLRV